MGRGKSITVCPYVLMFLTSWYVPDVVRCNPTSPGTQSIPDFLLATSHYQFLAVLCYAPLVVILGKDKFSCYSRFTRKYLLRSLLHFGLKDLFVMLELHSSDASSSTL